MGHGAAPCPITFSIPIKFRYEQAEKVRESQHRNNDTYPYRVKSSMQATHQPRRIRSQGEQVGARLLADRHSFWISIGRAMLAVPVRLFPPSLSVTHASRRRNEAILWME